MKKRFSRIISVILSVIMILASLPFSTVASASTLAELETEVNNRLLLYSGRVSYTTDVYMGNVKVQPYHVNNLIYSSKTLTKSYSDISSSIDFWMYCPKTVISLYDGIKTPSFPVSSKFLLKNYVRLCGIVLTDEEALYETSAPTNYKGASNVWRAINGDTTWHQPEDAESIMLLTSKRADYKYDLYYTRAQNAEYQVSASNTLSPRADYIENLLNNNEQGYIYSTSNDTTFQFVNRSFSDSSKIEEPVRIPLGEGATQYYVDYRPIIDIADKVRNDFTNIRNASSHYDEEAVRNYYQAIIDLTNLNVTTEFKDVNDDNASSMVESVSAKIKAVADNYNKTLSDIGEPYIDPSDAREYVTNNYNKSNINFASSSIKFGNTNLTNTSYGGTTYNFGKNLVFCSSTAEKSSDIGQNYVNSWVVMPKTVVMLYDGTNETSFPVKIGFGRNASDSSYTGSNLTCVYLGGESSNYPGSASSIYSLGNSNWLVSNAIASIPKESWFTSTQINGTMPAGTISGGGTNLSNQYGGMFNKIVLNNSLYAQNLKINPTDGKLITFYYKYYNPEYDTLPHAASIHTKQYVMNVVPLKEKLAKVESEYNAKIGTYGESTYPSDRLEAYYKATYKLLSFNINTQFIGCSDSNAYEKTEACYNNMLAVIDEYNEAYENLKELYTVTFVNYAGETVKEEQYEKNETPIPPENTPLTKISETSKYHYKYTWADMKPATANITYRERRATVACTLGEGEVVIKPTCKAEGKMKYHCSVCNGDYFEAIETIDHDYSVYKAQYQNGAKYDTSLKHDINCASGGETLASQTCTFELLSNGEATKIYQCRECGGMTVYNKAKYTVQFVDENGETISTKEYFEDQEIDVPKLPENGVDDSGHFSYKWNVEPSRIPTADVTYTIEKTTVKHTYTNYVYNNDANRANPYGTETAACDIDGCSYTDTRTCSDIHTPVEFEVNGKIMIAMNTAGDPSTTAANGVTIKIEEANIEVNANKNGEFTLPMLKEGEYTLTIGGDTVIERTITLIINAENADGDVITVDEIGIVPFDYNQDGIINTTDAAMMSKNDISKEEANLFKKLFNKSIKYKDIQIA